MGMYDYNGKEWIEWKPVEGELCMFYNDNSNSFRVARFQHVAWGEGKEGKFKDMQGNYFDHCEPYTGDIPSKLKGKI